MATILVADVLGVRAQLEELADEGKKGKRVEDAAQAQAHAWREHMPLDLALPQAEQSFRLDRPLREACNAFEKSYFEFHLTQEDGSITRVAETSGLARTYLYVKLKQLGVDFSRNKRGIFGNPT